MHHQSHKKRIAGDPLDQMITRDILKFSGEVMAKGPDGEMYIKPLIVSDYWFLELVVMGSLNISLMDGCNVQFKTHSNTYTQESDERSIETDYSLTLFKGKTEFDVGLEEEVLEALQKDDLMSITIAIPNWTGFLGSKREDIQHVFHLLDPTSIKRILYR